ncbi:hypothetical protein [Cryptosporangium phraense]|uniref:Uncharacterized protein n=1 Tax=Cryptosporangium phraense TaxID=2593070 RepID=A0A545ANH5_9ACTN|nr:hypothetical protein [Cryptosporangium phraense]TQS42820.1 hypothetical protein FL583_22465 [Cryptosporangium phraense]
MSTPWPSSALAAADQAFTALTTDPDPLLLDLDQFSPAAGLPSGSMPLRTLRNWLLEHPGAHNAQDAVWTELIQRARTGEPQWVITAVGMAMPSLLRSAVELRAGYPDDPDDIDSELLTGFLSALRDTRVPAAELTCARLCWAAWRAGHHLLRQAREQVPVDDLEHALASRPPRIPYGHPDVLVARAVALELVDEGDAEAWIDTRLALRDPVPLAAARRITVDALRMRLNRVDQRLAAALADGLLTGVASAEARAQLKKAAAHRTATRATRPRGRIHAA